MGKMIMDLNRDVFKHIMICVAKSGAENLARAAAVCRMFIEFVKATDVLKAACFDDVRLLSRYELFQQINGLLSISAQAGNSTAKFKLIQIILFSSSQLLEMECKSAHLESSADDDDHVSIDQACGSNDPQVCKEDSLAFSFMAQFTGDRSDNKEVPSKSLDHFELVRSFLHHCSPQDLAEMRTHLQSYYKYYFDSSEGGDLMFFDYINQLCILDDYLQAFEALEKLTDIVDNGVEIQGKLEKVKEEICEKLLQHKEVWCDATVESCYRLGLILIEAKTKSMGEDMEFEAMLHAQIKEFKDCSRKILEMFENHRSSAVPIFDKLWVKSM